MPLSAGDARRNRGGPESLGVEDELPEDEFPEELLVELPGTICAGGEPSELELALRIRGRSLSSLLDELLPDELLLDELLSVLSSELEVARRSLGRSGSLSLFDELLLDEPLLAMLSSELDAARRSLGRLLSLLDEPPDELFEALLDELPEDELPEDDLVAKGRDVSSVARDAAECSSAVPSLTIVMFTAW